MAADKRYPAFLIIIALLLGLFLYTSNTFQKTSSDAPVGATIEASKRGPGPSPAGTSLSGRTSLPVFPIDINKASVSELMLLPGIGEKTAQRIVEKRAELNGFDKVDDLTAVKWIGKVKLEKLRGLVTVSRPGKEQVKSGQSGN